ncbi:hypothetical protein BDY24DRAFT_394559 [Mrakia frigida]|uniref:uncharacterized protein n=1 Tax=Mrakia frigida TaxID=29902 RepID=UPI003FCC12E0
MSSLQFLPLPPIQHKSVQGHSLPSIRSILPPSSSIDEQRRLPPPPSFPSSATSYHPQPLADIRKLPRLFSPQGLKGHSFPVRFPTGDAVVGRRRVSGPRRFSGPTGRLGGGPFVRRLSPTFPLSNRQPPSLFAPSRPPPPNHDAPQPSRRPYLFLPPLSAPHQLSLPLQNPLPRSPPLERIQTPPSSPSQPLPPSTSSVLSQNVVATADAHPPSSSSAGSIFHQELNLELYSSEWVDDREEAEENKEEEDVEEASSRRLGEVERRTCSHCHFLLPVERFSVVPRGRRAGKDYLSCDLCREKGRQASRRSRTRLATSTVDASDGQQLRNCTECFRQQPAGHFAFRYNTGERFRTCNTCSAGRARRREQVAELEAASFALDAKRSCCHCHTTKSETEFKSEQGRMLKSCSSCRSRQLEWFRIKGQKLKDGSAANRSSSTGPPTPSCRLTHPSDASPFSPPFSDPLSPLVPSSHHPLHPIPGSPKKHPRSVSTAERTKGDGEKTRRVENR